MNYVLPLFVLAEGSVDDRMAIQAGSSVRAEGSIK